MMYSTYTKSWNNYTYMRWCHCFHFDQVEKQAEPRLSTNGVHAAAVKWWTHFTPFSHITSMCFLQNSPKWSNSEVLVSVPITVFWSNSKFHPNLKCSSLKFAQPITKKFCKRHEHYTVVTCANFVVIGRVHFKTSTANYGRISNSIKVLLVWRVPGVRMFTQQRSFTWYIPYIIGRWK